MVPEVAVRVPAGVAQELLIKLTVPLVSVALSLAVLI